MVQRHKHKIPHKQVLWERLLNTVMFLHFRLVPRQLMISDENQTPRILQTKTKDPNFSLFDWQRQADRNWGNGRKLDGEDSRSNLKFMGPCIVIIFQYISNKMQRYTVYFIWKLLYMFRMVRSLIIRSANNCIYSIWYLSHRHCYLPL